MRGRGESGFHAHRSCAPPRVGSFGKPQAAPDDAVPDDAAPVEAAVEPEDSDDGALAVPALSPALAFAELSAPEEPFSDLAGAPFDAPLAAPLLLLLPPRKSVTYQPEPFSWKPAAVTCFENVSFPHSGHCVSGLSLSFWSTSFWWPQDAQR
jgi:hypothetical protein